MSASETGTRLLLSRVGPVCLAFDVSAVYGVDVPDVVPTVDAFATLALDDASSSGRRRVRFRGRQEFDLRVGDGVRVVQVTQEALGPLPPFLSGMVERIGMVGVALVEDELALVLNPTALEPA